MGRQAFERHITLITMVPLFSIPMVITLRPCVTTRSNYAQHGVRAGSAKSGAPLNFTLGLITHDPQRTFDRTT